MILRKSNPPEHRPEKWTFLSLAFYNAPSLHFVKKKHYGMVALLRRSVSATARPPYLLRCEAFFERKMSVIPRQMVSAQGARAIVNHYVIVNLLRRANLLRRSYSQYGDFSEPCLSQCT